MSRRSGSKRSSERSSGRSAGGLQLDSFISRLQSPAPTLKEPEMKELCYRCREVFMLEEPFLRVSAPVTICGDIHGQFSDLLRIFRKMGWPPKVTYIFLGNYADYGPKGIETLCLLLAFKLKYPKKMLLLRGNHETTAMSRVFGLMEECRRRYSLSLWKLLCDVFNCMPFAALVSDRLFCVHSGLSRALRNLTQLKRIRRPCDIPDAGILCDLVWADPDRTISSWHPGPRGVSYSFSAAMGSEVLLRQPNRPYRPIEPAGTRRIRTVRESETGNDFLGSELPRRVPKRRRRAGRGQKSLLLLHRLPNFHRPAFLILSTSSLFCVCVSLPYRRIVNVAGTSHLRCSSKLTFTVPAEINLNSKR